MLIIGKSFEIARELPRVGVESELQLHTYTTVMAILDLSHICNLYGDLQQRHILHPLSKAGNQTRVVMDTSQICYR